MAGHKSSPKPPSKINLLRAAEWIVAGVAMAAILVLHFINRTHIGALWRDELNSVNLATMPTLAELWQNFEFDSVPAVWISVLRLLHALGLGTDTALRNFGLLLGLMLIGVLWLNSHRFRLGFPFLSLALIGLSPVVIRWGDGLRAYGLGMILILLTFRLVWDFVLRPSMRNFVLALLCALGSVHTLYYNSVLLFAICTSGAIVAATRRQWKMAVAILGIGLITALTLLVYSGPLAKEHEWYVVVLMPSVSFGFLFQKLVEALTVPGIMVGWLWAMAVMSFVIFAVICLLDRRTLHVSDEQRALLIYSLSALLIGSLAYSLFLKRLSYVTNPWYFLGWMSLTAVAMDAGFASLRSVAAGRVSLMSFVVVMLALSFSGSMKALSERITNVDLVARAVSQNATPRDLVVVNPWFAGITFQRYYTGAAPWVTVPPVSEHRVHRYDIVKEMMSLPQPAAAIQPVADRIATTLRAGDRVWLAGGLEFLPQGQAPLTLPPAPQSQYGWMNVPYYEMWYQHAGSFIQQHARRAQLVKVPVEGPVAYYENLPLVLVEGWHE